MGRGGRTVQLVLGERERDVHGVVDRVLLEEGDDRVDFLVVLGRAARLFFVMRAPAGLQPVVDREVVRLLQVERDAVTGEVRPLRGVVGRRRDGTEDVREVRGRAARGCVQVRVELAEVRGVERGVEDGGLWWEVEEARWVGQDVVEWKQPGSSQGSGRTCTVVE